MIINRIAVLVLAFGALISSPCYSETAYAVEGRISGIDTFRSIVTVKTLSHAPVIAYSEVDLFVGPKTKITHKGDTASIFDLLKGSPVRARYVDKGGALEALEIAVTGGI